MLFKDVPQQPQGGVEFFLLRGYNKLLEKQLLRTHETHIIKQEMITIVCETRCSAHSIPGEVSLASLIQTFLFLSVFFLQFFPERTSKFTSEPRVDSILMGANWCNRQEYLCKQNLHILCHFPQNPIPTILCLQFSKVFGSFGERISILNNFLKKQLCFKQNKLWAFPGWLVFSTLASEWQRFKMELPDVVL